MDPKLSLLLLLLLVTVSVATDVEWGLAPLAATKRCDGSVGDCSVGEEEELGLGTETGRRQLRRRSNRFISYDALKRNLVPCSRRGRSYYNCQQQGKANPYDRGCTVITRCARDTG